jgi:predicted AAA+ superfamily ATPase
MPTTAADPAAGREAGELLLRLVRWLEYWLPPEPPTDWSAQAYQWRKRRALGTEHAALVAVHRVARIEAGDLLGVERQKEALLRNTEQFVRALPANNVLLTGARGTGKSSLVRACLARFAADGLRLIEVDKDDLVDLPRIADLVAGRPERFVVFCDDLSFEPSESSYKALKAALDGSVAAGAANLLIYATSNRRHLMPESMRENLAAEYDAQGDLHPGETSEEKVSLSERFGLWLSFHSFRQDEYLQIVGHWLARFELDAAAIEQARGEALQFALQRGSRSGRVAAQFARDYAGRRGLSGA